MEACEDCLEVCFVRLVVERICVWCLVIFMGFGQAGAKRGMLKSHQLEVVMQVTKGWLFSYGRQVLTM